MSSEKNKGVMEELSVYSADLNLAYLRRYWGFI